MVKCVYKVFGYVYTIDGNNKLTLIIINIFWHVFFCFVCIYSILSDDSPVNLSIKAVFCNRKKCGC